MNNSYHTPSLILAVGIHLGVVLFALVAPLLLKTHRHIPEVYQVRLYTPPQPIPSPPPAKTAPVVPPSVEIQAPPVEVQSQPVKIQQPVEVQAPKAVSLAPLKKRLAKEQEQKEDKARKSRTLARRLEQVEMEVKSQQAEEEARAKAKEAISKLADLYRTTNRAEQIVKPGESTPINGTPLPASINGLDPALLEAIERYKARLIEHIQKNWELPELHKWDETLEAVIVLEVQRNGTVISSHFEKKSKDARFNKHVTKAMEKSSPLPPFPVDLKAQKEEIVVTFFPGGLM
ncbi:MAG: TonB C-terminal domain-containing protein [Proteobacteria bacterium]|nr:TonB C-terminal domain-containing protein [Pseudomonadota bacterium]MBU1686449.1 TonB C-terminal domain-containing protein [Pseudomonadota bacterium]